MPISPLYIALIVVTLAIGGFATFYVNSKLKKYKKVPSALGITGAEMARRMLAANGVSGVSIHQGAPGQDHFDPRMLDQRHGDPRTVRHHGTSKVGR